MWVSCSIAYSVAKTSSVTLSPDRVLEREVEEHGKRSVVGAGMVHVAASATDYDVNVPVGGAGGGRAIAVVRREDLFERAVEQTLRGLRVLCGSGGEKFPEIDPG